MREYIVKDTGDIMMVGGKIIQELVRCNDCKFFEDKNNEYNFCWCNKKDMQMEVPSGNWFCAYGERRKTDA